MKTNIACAAMVAALGFGEAAHAGGAYVINPTNSSFTATGPGSIVGSAGSYDCTITMTGTTGRANASINGVTLSGAAGCENVMAMGLPWKFAATSLHKAQIVHFSLRYPGLGKCGPNQVNASISQGNILIQDHIPSQTGICKIDVSLTSSPPLSISSK